MIYGYCRVSTKGQAKDGNSLETQQNIKFSPLQIAVGGDFFYSFLIDIG